MPSRSARRQLGLFGNPVGDFSLEELTETVRMLEREQPGRTVDELSRAVFAELAMKQTRRAAELVAEAIRVARAGEPRAEITGSRDVNQHQARAELRRVNREIRRLRAELSTFEERRAKLRSDLGL